MHSIYLNNFNESSKNEEECSLRCIYHIIHRFLRQLKTAFVLSFGRERPNTFEIFMKYF